MVATLAGNPYVTTVSNGTFNTQSKGLTQGDVYPDPSTRYARRGGVLASSETLPMWGGVGVYALIPGNSSNPPSVPVRALGATLGRATALTGSKPLLGFSVFEGAYNMVNNPQSPVPLIGSYGSVMYYALGSRARIIVQCSPNLINYQGEPLNQPVSWDFTNQQLEPYVSTTIASGTYTTAATISSGTYNSTTGAVSLTMNASHGLTAGDAFVLSGLTGTGSFASLNGTWVATAGTTGSTLNFTAPTGLTLTITGGSIGTGVASLTTSAAHGLLPGDTFELSAMTGTNAATYLDGEQTAAAGTTGTTLNVLLASGLTLTISGGTLGSGGALAVDVLEVQSTNCMVVEYSTVTGFATWNYNGACAVIQI